MRLLILTLLILPFFFIPETSFAQLPLVPCNGPDCGTCQLVQLGNNIITWLVSVMAVVCAIVIVFAGFKMVTSSGNSGEISKAKEMISNTLIGFVILLAAWLIVDTVMKMFVNEGTLGRPWAEIECISATTPTATPTTGTVGAGGGSLGTVAPSRGTGALCSTLNPYCSPTTLQAAGLTQSQANVMSCIAMTESSGNPTVRTTVPGSSACGLFQVTSSTWRTLPLSSSCSSFSQCTNATCNIEAATALVRSRGYNPWTCPGCNSRAQDCVNRYGG